MLLPLPLRMTTLTGVHRFAENDVAATRLRQAAALDLIDLPALLFSTTRNRAGTLRTLDANNQTRLDIDFLNLGDLGSLTVDDAGGIRNDALFVNGTADDDRFDLNSSGDWQL